MGMLRTARGSFSMWELGWVFRQGFLETWLAARLVSMASWKTFTSALEQQKRLQSPKTFL